MKKNERLSLSIIADKIKKAIGDDPNYYQLQRNTGVHRIVIKNIYTGAGGYQVSALINLCNALDIDLLK